MSAERHVVVVDLETSGLRPIDVAVEVAWWDLDSDHRGAFIPPHDVDWVLHHGDPQALEINDYFRRGLDREPQDRGYTETRRLHAALSGNTLAGSNPRFDAAMLYDLFFDDALDPEPWHYRLWDLSAYAAGVLGLNELPGLAKVCELLGIPGGDHTAEGDVTATGLCLRMLMAKAGLS